MASLFSAEIIYDRPPTDCGPVGSWAGISLNFTVTSNGYTVNHVIATGFAERDAEHNLIVWASSPSRMWKVSTFVVFRGRDTEEYPDY